MRLYRVTSEPDFHTKDVAVVYIAAVDFDDLARHRPHFAGAAEIAKVELLGEVTRTDDL